MPAVYRIFADLVVLVHVTFVVFVVFGGLVALKWRRVVWVHLTAVVWAAIVEFSGWICPLTPLENWLRTKTGENGYHGDFVAYYILPVLYPSELTRELQIGLGIFVIALNLALYSWFFFRSERKAEV